MDLFAAAEGIKSGEVPREPFPGIVWDEACEDEFGKAVLAWRERFPKVADEPKSLAATVQSAIWAIEIRLIREAIGREAERAVMLDSPGQKRALHDEWLRRYGALMTNSIVAAVKDPQLRSPDLGKRL